MLKKERKKKKLVITERKDMTKACMISNFKYYSFQKIISTLFNRRIPVIK